MDRLPCGGRSLCPLCVPFRRVRPSPSLIPAIGRVDGLASSDSHPQNLRTAVLPHAQPVQVLENRHPAILTDLTQPRIFDHNLMEFEESEYDPTHSKSFSAAPTSSTDLHNNVEHERNVAVVRSMSAAGALVLILIFMY